MGGLALYYGERFNAWTHLVGAVLALSGAIVLVVLAIVGGDVWKLAGVSVFGASLVLLYAVSTLYHSVRGRTKQILRKLDHLSIYLLIAGSYAPFCLVSLRGPWGWSLLGLVWGLALFGMLQEFRLRSERRILSLVIYAVMGWAAIAAFFPLLEALGMAGFAWLVGGGLCYTVGMVFYLFDHRFRYWHGVWHLFVLAGSALHYFAVLLHVL